MVERDREAIDTALDTWQQVTSGAGAGVSFDFRADKGNANAAAVFALLAAAVFDSATEARFVRRGTWNQFTVRFITAKDVSVEFLNDTGGRTTVVKLTAVERRLRALAAAANSEPGGTQIDEVVLARQTAISLLDRLASPLPSAERLVYQQLVSDTLGAVDSAAEINRLRNIMAVYLVDNMARTWVALPESGTVWLTVVSAALMVGVLVLGVIASIVQIQTANMPVWLVVAIWVTVLSAIAIGGWWRWRQLHRGEFSDPAADR